MSPTPPQRATAQQSRPRPPRSRIGPNIRKARGQAGLSQLALAHLIGYRGEDAGAYICRVEGGRQQPRLDTLTRISKALGVELGTLL